MEATGEVTIIGALLFFGVLLTASSGVPGLFLKNASGIGQKFATALMAAGSLAGISGAAAVFMTERTETFTINWSLPFDACEIGIDPLSALFLLPIFVVSLCCALYANGYWPAAKHPANIRKLTFFFGLLTSALALLVMARNGVLFLMAWEIMAISCYFALTAEDEKPEVREAGTLYMITTHIGTLALFAMFALLRTAGSSFRFPLVNSLDAAGPLAAAIFAAALFGFGLKAGLMPLHIWLPSAHANAPSHVSALMSGVLIKMGIYGLVRTLSFFTHIPLWWGITVLVIGIVSGVLGVTFAIGQHDLKRLLAYHSIENIGIIAMGIGVALIGRTMGNPTLVLLGLAGALLHVLNHAIFKSLLFLSAGSVIHAIGTREIDLMGGLARRIPYTAVSFLTGAVAICGLPPLNGFVSEFLIYLGFFSGVKEGTGAAMPFLALAAPSLALIGGLAVACFIKVYGIAFLGLPRSREAGEAHEGGWEMRAPMLFLAILCGFIGIFPPAVAQLLERAAFAWLPELAVSGRRLATAAPLGWITVVSFALLGIVAGLAFIFRKRLKAGSVGSTGTWDCGYARPAPRMQYSASSFGEMLVKLSGGVLRPHRELPEIKGLFAGAARFASHVPETVLELIYLPFLRRANEKLSVVRKLQHGQLHLYILYTFATLVLLLIWAQ
ncbi:MAG: NADH dehydrogenase [Geobacteraceae bacterium]|nr:MAG: NADH dehydrogenase [Geobacteraceae bacterium]